MNNKLETLVILKNKKQILKREEINFNLRKVPKLKHSALKYNSNNLISTKPLNKNSIIA